VEALMVGGASPAAADGGGNGGLSDIWRANSTAFVPALYGIIAIVGWWKSPTAPSVGQLELASGVVLLALAAAVVVLKLPIGSRQDYFGGLGLLALALFAMWASRDLPGMRGFAFGPGTAPRMFAVMLGILGVAVAVVGFFAKSMPIQPFGVRGPIFILASTFLFAACIRPLGLVVASFVSIAVSAGATTEVRWLETIIWAAVLTAFCALLFPWGLNLPLPMWPTIDILHVLGVR
jgi:putative tricarboxylic transport membrane protein